MADVVVLMKDGRIVQSGSPEALYNKPETTFVAEFVGAPPMALINSSALEGFGDNQTIGVRTENVSISPTGKGRLSCVVRESEFLGAETMIGLEHENATGLTVMMPGLALKQEGEPIDISFNDSDLHVFDAQGKRVLAT